MLINNGQNTRSYSPVPAGRSDSSENPEELMKKHVKKQIEHTLKSAITTCELSEAYWKMGLCGHMHKLHHKAHKMHKKVHKWSKYYREVFDECPKLELEYSSEELPKTVDGILNKLYELHVSSKENIDQILKLATENHVYSEMKLLLELYQDTEKAIEKLESKMRTVQVFGYDVANLLALDEEYLKMHKECEKRKEK